MSIDNIKNSFIKHLTDKLNKNLFGSFDPEKYNPENFSIFEFFNEFHDYLNFDLNCDMSLFSFSMDDVDSVVDNLSLLSQGDAEGTVTQTNIEGYLGAYKQEFGNLDMYAEIFKDANIIGMFDADGDGQLSNVEMTDAFKNIAAIDGVADEVSIKDFLGLQTYIQDFIAKNPDLTKEELVTKLAESIKGLDGVSDNFSVGDFAKLGEQIEPLISGSITPEQLVSDIAQTIKDVIPDSYAQKVSKAATTFNNHESNYTGPSGELKSMELTKAVQAQDGDIASLQNQIAQQNAAKAKALGASEAYFAENKYTEKLSSLNTLISDINTYNSSITSIKSDLHETQYDLNAAKVELDNLQDPVVFDEYQSEIDARRTELQKQITELTQKEQSLQTQLKDTENNLKTAKSDREALEAEIKTIEDNNPDSASKAAIAEYNKTIAQLEQKISAAQAKKQSAENTLDAQREQEIKDSDVYGKALAYRQSEFVKFMMDYATKPETKKKYDALHNSNYGAYCAVFTSDVSEVMYSAVINKLGIDPKTMNTYGDRNNGSQGLTGDQMAMAASAWGDKIKPALDALGLGSATIDIHNLTASQKADLVREGKIYPGMTFEYGGSYHTGFIESINKDLSWNTIEGNTFVRYADGKSESGTVGSHKRDATYERMYAATDSTIKALIWAYQAGKITKEQMQAMTYAAHFAA